MWPKLPGVTVDSAALREKLKHLYWIGGGSCAGKSTIARRLAAQHGLRVYATDDVMADRARRSTYETLRCCTSSWPWTWMSDG